MSSEPSRRGVLMCTFGMCVLGASVPISRLVLGYPVLTGQAARYTVAVAVFVLVGRLRSGRWPWSGVARWDWVRLGALALSGLVLFNVLLLTALRHADPAVVGTVVAGTPLVLALVGPLSRRERPALRLVGAAAVVIAGGALVHGGGRVDAVGLLAAVGTLAGEVLFSLLAVPLLPRLGPLRVSTLSCLLAVPMLAAAALVNGEVARLRLPTAPEVLGYGYLGAVLTVVAFLAWYGGLGRLGPERAGLFVGLVPPVSLALTALLDRRAPGGWQVSGVLLVAAGLVAGLGATARRFTGPPAARSRPAGRPADVLRVPRRASPAVPGARPGS